MKGSLRRGLLLSIAGALALPASAAAALVPIVAAPGVRVTGAIEVIPPPASVRQFELASDETLFLFEERRAPWIGDTPLDLLPGDQYAAPTANEAISYFVHFERPVFGGPIDGPLRRSGSATFPGRVLGVAYTADSLDRTLPFGAQGTLYPEVSFTPAFYQLEFSPAPNPQGVRDFLDLQPDGRTLFFDFGAATFPDQVRVFVAVPEPTSLALTLATMFGVATRRR